MKEKDKVQEKAEALENPQAEKEAEKEEKVTSKPAGENVTVLKEALADYVISRMPKEMADSFYSGSSIGEIISQWENAQLKKENQELKLKLEKEDKKPLTLTGQGGGREKDPFALGFLDAMNSY